MAPSSAPCAGPVASVFPSLGHTISVVLGDSTPQMCHLLGEHAELTSLTVHAITYIERFSLLGSPAGFWMKALIISSGGPTWEDIISILFI